MKRYTLHCFTTKPSVQNSNVLKKLTKFDPSDKAVLYSWTHVGGEVTLQVCPIYMTINQGSQVNFPLCFCRNESVSVKGLSLRKRREALCIPHCGNSRALCTLLSLLTPYVSTCFPFLFGVSANCVTQGESRVSGASVCMEMGCQALFALASASCGYQPVANCQPAISPAASRPALLPHPAHSPRPRLDAHHSISWTMTSSGDSLPSRLRIMRIRASRFRFVCPRSEQVLFFSMKRTQNIKHNPNGRYSSSWFSESN